MSDYRLFRLYDLNLRVKIMHRKDLEVIRIEDRDIVFLRKFDINFFLA